MGCSASKPDEHPNAAGASQQASNKAPTTPSSSSTKNGARSSYVGDNRKISDYYSFGDVLGTGSYSVVKLGTSKADPSLRVAVKVMSRSKMKPDEEANILREVDIMRSLDHPNIVRLYDLFSDENNFYVVMEYVGGGELFERLVEKAVYDEEEARNIAVVMFQAIKYMHDKDLVHRDIKPENILLVSKDDDVSLKIADFGFAVRLTGSAGVKQQAGTPGYVSPEVLERKPHGKPVDLWAMGVILFMLLGGYPPFYEPDGNTKTMFRRIINGDYVFHPDYWSDISEEAKDLIRGLLTVDPSKRLTVEQALAHPWVHKPKEEFSLVPLTKTVYALREYRAKISFAKANAAVASATIEAIKKVSSAALLSNNPTAMIASSVTGLTSTSSGVFSDVAIDVIRKISNTNLDREVIEAARRNSRANMATSSTGSTRRPSRTPGSAV